MLREKECAICGASFHYPIKRGCERRQTCSPECRKALIVRQRLRRKAMVGTLTCRIEGCIRPITRVRSKLCEGCYMRIRRNGDSAYYTRVAKPKRLHSHGYVVLHQPKHPLACTSGSVGEHRLVVYDVIGGGSHPCHWCGRLVSWRGPKDDCLVVDHLNDVKTDNSLTNLVPSCNDCNRARGAMQPFLRRLRPVARDQLVELIQAMDHLAVQSRL